jgi:flagellar biosynthesis/type III secretory pathway chaperone
LPLRVFILKSAISNLKSWEHHMANVETPQSVLAALEEALVGEFRAYQTLVEFAKDERRLLSGGDFTALLDLIAQKEKLVDELGRLEKKRLGAIEQWTRAAGDDAPPPTLADLLPGLDAATAERLGRLRRGILALVDQLRDLTRSNRLLAEAGMERVEAVRYFLLSLSQLPLGYRPPGQPAPEETGAALAVEQWA